MAIHKTAAVPLDKYWVLAGFGRLRDEDGGGYACAADLLVVDIYGIVCGVFGRDDGVGR